MGHLLLARCTTDHPAIRALDAAFDATLADPAEPRVDRISRLDLDQGPRVGRLRATIGLGWNARDRLRRVALTTGRAVDSVIEICVCGHHHLLGLGRAGVPSVRWAPRGPAERTWLDEATAREGTLVILAGAVPDTQQAESIITRLMHALDEQVGADSPGGVDTTRKP